MNIKQNLKDTKEFIVKNRREVLTDAASVTGYAVAIIVGVIALKKHYPINCAYSTKEILHMNKVLRGKDERYSKVLLSKEKGKYYYAIPPKN